VFSHGHGGANFLSSLRGYGPLADFWAANGFVVVQPTHLDSTVLGLREQDLPDAPLFWRDRALDMHAVLDRLPEILSAIVCRNASTPAGSRQSVTHWAATRYRC